MSVLEIYRALAKPVLRSHRGASRCAMTLYFPGSRTLPSYVVVNYFISDRVTDAKVVSVR